VTNPVPAGSNAFAGTYRCARRAIRIDVGPAKQEPSSADGRLPQFRCTGCGYGASCRIAPERCPMCGGSTWEYAGDREAR
jgi:rubrerythrin